MHGQDPGERDRRDRDDQRDQRDAPDGRDGPGAGPLPGPGPDPGPRPAAGPEIVRLLRAVAAGLSAHGARFAQRNGMHPTDVRAVTALLDASGAGEELTAGRLGAALGLNSAGTTALVDRLERAGHARRVRGRRDRRHVVVRVEDRAVGLVGPHTGRLADRATALLRDYDERELAAVHRFLTGMRDAAHATDTDA
ncbi:MarR family transcriptional regulator [Streptomyces tagetis]|uniref:MarR family transcriptional regulator n=1 Tax=Streptomyces tagetis TaxID=2820809 RepID=A0A941B9Y2_9ACTN|nr:MarR family transcriptional regulator [Streptomyces sp. RG38]